MQLFLLPDWTNTRVQSHVKHNRPLQSSPCPPVSVGASGIRLIGYTVTPEARCARNVAHRLHKNVPENTHAHTRNHRPKTGACSDPKKVFARLKIPQCHCIMNVNIFCTAYTQNLSLSHSFWKLSLEQQKHTPNLQNHTLLLSIWLVLRFIKHNTQFVMGNLTGINIMAKVFMRCVYDILNAMLHFALCVCVCAILGFLC